MKPDASKKNANPLSIKRGSVKRGKQPTETQNVCVLPNNYNEIKREPYFYCVVIDSDELKCMHIWNSRQRRVLCNIPVAQTPKMTTLPSSVICPHCEKIWWEVAHIFSNLERVKITENETKFGSLQLENPTEWHLFTNHTNIEFAFFYSISGRVWKPIHSLEQYFYASVAGSVSEIGHNLEGIFPLLLNIPLNAKVRRTTKLNIFYILQRGTGKIKLPMPFEIIAVDDFEMSGRFLSSVREYIDDVYADEWLYIECRCQSIVTEIDDAVQKFNHTRRRDVSKAKIEKAALLACKKLTESRYAYSVRDAIRLSKDALISLRQLSDYLVLAIEEGMASEHDFTSVFNSCISLRKTICDWNLRLRKMGLINFHRRGGRLYKA